MPTSAEKEPLNTGWYYKKAEQKMFSISTKELTKNPSGQKKYCNWGILSLKLRDEAGEKRQQSLVWTKTHKDMKNGPSPDFINWQKITCKEHVRFLPDKKAKDEIAEDYTNDNRH